MVQILGSQLFFDHVVQKQSLHLGINVRSTICKRRAHRDEVDEEAHIVESPFSPPLDLEMETENKGGCPNSLTFGLYHRK